MKQNFTFMVLITLKQCCQLENEKKALNFIEFITLKFVTFLTTFNAGNNSLVPVQFGFTLYLVLVEVLSGSYL